MSHPDDQAIAERLLPDANRRLIRTADALTDEQYDAPSGLPGWTRAHVLAHLALNAEALTGVLDGIAEGRRVSMYPSQEARDGDIAELASKTPSAIRTRLLGGSTELTDAIDAVPEDEWSLVIERVPGGPTFPAAAIPGMRLREVEIHHVDLDAGYGWSDWPREFATHLLDAMLTSRATVGSFTARPADVDRSWTFGSGGPAVFGPAAALGWWLTGRGDGEGVTSESGELPQIGAW